MLKISDAIRDIVAGNSLLGFGMHHRLLNLSQVSRFIQPMIEARTKKEVKPSAILMNLSRMQNQVELPEVEKSFFINQVTIQSGLCCLTYIKTTETHRGFHRCFAAIQEKNGFMTITEGIREITVIVENEHRDLVSKMVPDRPSFVHEGIASVGVKFRRKFLSEPGLIYRVLQQLAVQNINVTEVTSTATELYVYLADEDVEVAFDSIYKKFGRT